MQSLIRNRWFPWVLALVMLCAGCSVPPAARKPMQSWAYAGWWMPLTEQGIKDGGFDRLVYFEIQIGGDGGIQNANGWPARQTALRQLSRTLDIPLDLTLTIKDSGTFTELFSNPESVERLVETSRTLVDDDDVSGLHLDFEFYEQVPPETLAALRQYMDRLGTMLHDGDRHQILSVFVPTGGPPIHDGAGLRNADWVVMQAYDSHWLTSQTAGPIAPLDGPEGVTWAKVADQAIALGVPKDRILLSYPLYAYEWPMKEPNPRGVTSAAGLVATLEQLPGDAGSSRIFSVAERVAEYGCTHDSLSGSSYYQLPHADSWITGWYEGMNSLRLRTDFLQEHALGGMAFFIVGYDGYALTSAYNAARKGIAPIPRTKC